MNFFCQTIMSPVFICGLVISRSFFPTLVTNTSDHASDPCWLRTDTLYSHGYADPGMDTERWFDRQLCPAPTRSHRSATSHRRRLFGSFGRRTTPATSSEVDWEKGGVTRDGARKPSAFAGRGSSPLFLRCLPTSSPRATRAIEGEFR